MNQESHDFSRFKYSYGNSSKTSIYLEMQKMVEGSIERENLQENCATVGNYLLEGLRRLQTKYECIGDVRGSGLMIGVDLVKNRETKEPDNQLTSQVHELSKDLGLIIGKGGLYRNVLRIKPPLCISKEDVNFIVDVLDYIFHQKS